MSTEPKKSPFKVWFAKNHEKVILAGAVVAAAGLVFVGIQKKSSVAEAFGAEAKGIGPNDPAVKNGDLVSTAKASFGIKHEWIQGDDEGRPVDLFTGIALFVNKNDKSTPLDLIEGPPVHDPIPNSWWLLHRIDLGFGDSPLRDADEDGFSNMDEFIAQSDPKDPVDYPSLLSKLSFVKDESMEWVLRPGFEAAGAFTFEYSDALGRKNNVGAATPVPAGQLFFEKGPAKGRFKLIGSEKGQELNKATNTQVEITLVEVEDQKPNKVGTRYKIPSMFRRGDAGKFSYFDRTAVLTLDALGLVGKEFKVEENTEFSLPPGGEKKEYKLLSVTPDKVVVETTGKDGAKMTFVFPKGNLGPAAP